jgi:DNA-binding CsgD family transcriptional regulator
LAEPKAHKQALKSVLLSGCIMQKTDVSKSVLPTLFFNRSLALPAGLMILQIVAALFFVVDGFEDWLVAGADGRTLELAMESVIAIALFAGVVLSSMNIVRLSLNLIRKEQSLARARGALSEHIDMRFKEWRLTKGEGEVALFALKGCDIAEIARLRGAAAGTIRSQLSQVYAKAGVSSQAALVSVFIDDLLDVLPEGEIATHS